VFTDVQDAGNFAGGVPLPREPDQDGSIGGTHCRRERSNGLDTDWPRRGEWHHRHGFTEAVTENVEVRRTTQDESQRPTFFPQESSKKCSG
jgi:hypothetical protein